MGRFSGRRIGSQETCLSRVSRICFRGKAVERRAVLSCQVKFKHTDIHIGYGVFATIAGFAFMECLLVPCLPDEAGVFCFITEDFGEARKPKFNIKKYEQSFHSAACKRA